MIEQEGERENSSYLPTLENTLPIITVFAAILAENEKSREMGDGGGKFTDQNRQLTSIQPTPNINLMTAGSVTTATRVTCDIIHCGPPTEEKSLKAC